MPPKRRRRAKGHRHFLLMLFFITVVIFFFYREASRETPGPQPQQTAPEQARPETEKRPASRPEVAIVIDDLGPGKKAALSVLNINASLTLSVLPHEPFSKWIAGQGHKMGRDVIGHIPMEARDPHALGKGGLYTWMTDNEILDALKDDLASIPHIKGISNHMGSAFTEDERTMYVLMSGISREKLFFLDSLTTSRSVASKAAEEHGVPLLKRDIFLDYKDNPADIEAQWEKLIGIARKKGYAIAIAHPRKNTIDFLQKVLPAKQVSVVPVSRLVNSP
ncbi:MAG TPA: divergent polysaccharide deacetylase family protein [Nitrospirae bacterium]|nr:divergent polysaccharide deacetylase family protein [Nitrospirota bacterium]